MMHVDDMSPAERFAYRSQQLADLVVLAQRESLPAAVDQLAGFCEVSRTELLIVAVDQLSLLVGEMLSEATRSDEPQVGGAS